MIPEKTEFDNYRLIYKSSQIHLIELMKAKLRADDIHFFILNKQDSSYNSFGEIELYVKADDVVRAKFIIESTNE